MHDALNRLQGLIGYHFSDLELLELALTHRSSGRRNNERLEFLGDAVLSQVISEQLFRQFPDAHEGELSRMRAALVRGETLAVVGRELKLDEHIRLGPGEKKSGAWRRDSIMADVFEAVLGAVFLDSNIDVCRQRVLHWFETRLQDASPEQLGKDPKTRLQELLQRDKHPLPVYGVTRVTGEGHESEFEVSCQVAELNKVTEGRGSSRQKAEQQAAKRMLAVLENYD